MTALLLWLEGTALAEAMRQTLWLYPLVNTLHVLAAATLFGAILLADLRLLGLGRRIAVEPLLGFALPAAWTGFALALPSGLLLFLAEAPVHAANPFLRAKLLLLLGAGLNALVFQRLRRSGRHAGLSGLVSLGLWLGILVCGRLIAYW